MTTTETTLSVPATRYEDHDDCLAAAQDDARRALGLAGWDLSPRWASDGREAIVLTVPAWAARPDALAAIGAEVE